MCGVLHLSEKYFDMNRKQCKQGLAHYKKFIVRMDGVSKFLKVAEVKPTSRALSSSAVDVVLASVSTRGHLVSFLLLTSVYRGIETVSVIRPFGVPFPMTYFSGWSFLVYLTFVVNFIHVPWS